MEGPSLDAPAKAFWQRAEYRALDSLRLGQTFARAALKIIATVHAVHAILPVHLRAASHQNVCSVIHACRASISLLDLCAYVTLLAMVPDVGL